MSIFENIRRWHLSRQRRAILNSLSEHILTDIGLVRYGRKIEFKR